jgi:membrane fusion protein, multidrug efflux system
MIISQEYNMKTSASTSNQSNKKNSLFRLALFSTILGMSVLTTACSDDSGKDDSQAQTQDDKSTDKSSTQSDDKKKDAKKDSDKTAETKDGKKKKEIAPIPVEVVSVARGDIQQTYRTITTLEAEQDAQVVARSTGILEDILVEEGDMVEKGQLLAQLDVEQLTLEVTQKEATLNKLKKELNRQQSLYKRKLTSSDALDRATYEFQSQQAQYKLSKLKLNYAGIKAPISGIITERLVKTGNLIRDNDLLFKIVDLSSLKAVLHLPEKELANIKKGQNILLNIDALEDEVIVGEIERVRPSIDTDTGTFKVVASLSNENNFLKSGMFGKVEVVFDVHQDSLLLEQEAVITQDNRSHVFVVDGEKAIQTPVTIGFRYNGLVEVIEGLSESDQVITTGQQILKHESKIEVVGLNEDQLAEEKLDQVESPSSVAMNP